MGTIEIETTVDLICKHDNIMHELQNEWDDENMYHKLQRLTVDQGIRSSQISALVMLLVKKGVI